MYTTCFGFDSKPFKPKDTKSFYRNANFNAACADLLDGIRERRGFMLLLGDAGVGKTFTLRRCMAEADDIRCILLTNASLGFPDIISYLCTHLNLAVERLNPEQQIQLLLDMLAARARHNEFVVLLIDDAHHLRTDVLSRLWDFVETPALPSQRLQVVLAGLPELEGKLRQPELRPLHEHILTRCRLQRLSDQETELFINHQLRVAGHGGSGLLSSAAIERIATYCLGVPRAIAMLCDSILLLASLESEREITPELVDEAAQNCFLGEQPGVRPENLQNDLSDASRAASEPPVVASSGIEFELDLPEFDFAFNFDLEDTLVIEPSAAVIEAPAMVEATPADVPSTDGKPATADGQARGDAATESLESILASVPSLAPPVREFARLLDESTSKQDRQDARDREMLRYFRNRYLRWMREDPSVRRDEFEQRILRLTETQQPVLVSLAIAVNAAPEQDGALCTLLINPTWWLYREIRLRLRSSELIFADEGRIPPLRLLDGRDAHPVYLSYRYRRPGPIQATLWLELDLCDHRGQWHGYDNRSEIRLDFFDRGERDRDTTAATGVEPRFDRFWLEPPADTATAGSWLLTEPGSEHAAERAGGLACTPPLELEINPERTDSLRSRATSTRQALNRGSPLTRALLLSHDPELAPARIELVSRPFMVFGRHGASADTGFGDFTLGFVPKYNRISRLHCVICALSDQLALMPASDQGNTYTGRNGQRLERGRWEILQTGDVLDICGLYGLRLTLAWDHKWQKRQLDWNAREPRDKFGHYLLELVDVLRQRDRQAGDDELRKDLKNRYLNLLRMQDRVAGMNGVGNPGALLYARFEREDAAGRQIIHYYVPKWLSVGNSPQAGLCINAAGVMPRHAELFFRDGMYWIQNLAGPDAVRIGCHGLASNEVLALEAGDVLMMGSARFVFEAY